MPIYEYACENCDSEFEVEQRITEDPIRDCPHCSSNQVKRLISKTSFVLKGGGWYSDLYASSKEDAKPADKPDSDKSKSGESAADSKSKSKTKTAEKSESKSQKKGKSAGKSSRA
jgi:putative FmdB family regulatory protein